MCDGGGEGGVERITTSTSAVCEVCDGGGEGGVERITISTSALRCE